MINIIKERNTSFRYNEYKPVKEAVFNELCKLAIKNMLIQHEGPKHINSFLNNFLLFKNAIGADFRQNIINYTRHRYKLNHDRTISLIVTDIHYNNDYDFINLVKTHWDEHYSLDIGRELLDRLKANGLIEEPIYKILHYDLKGNSGGWGAYFGGGNKGKGKGGDPERDSWAKIKATMDIYGLSEYTHPPETYGASDSSVLSWFSQYWTEYAEALNRKNMGLKISRRIVRWAAANGTFLQKY